jgi:chromate transporter
VAVAVVAHAVFGMARSLLTTSLRWLIAAIVAVALLGTQLPLVVPLLILIGGASGAVFVAKGGADSGAVLRDTPGVKGRAWLWLAPIAGMAAALILTETLSPGLPQLVAGMARTGALVFGGGHAVLPLMEADALAHGWMSRDAFLAGYGAAQALPGPLFTFAAFVGSHVAGVGGALAALAAIFAPGLLLVAAAVPWWERLKHAPRAQGFVAGAGAAVVGVLAATLWDPLMTSGIASPADAVVALTGFALLQWAKAPSWLVVALVAAAGTQITG